MPIIDLRSDTVTRPSKEMLKAMMEAPVGDDDYGEDPSVNKLQNKLADLFSMESALFCPSGTMSNQIAIKAHTQPGDEIILNELSHVYRLEGGGIAYNSHCSVKLTQGDHGKIKASQLENCINEEDIHFPHSKVVSIENTCNLGGGSCYDIKEVEAIATFCKQQGLILHMDGARIFNALVATHQHAEDYGRLCDSISVCLSKGLGAPVGSVLIGNRDFIQKARRIRKVMGGGMRQAGILAAAGIYALDHNIQRLSQDHQRAAEIANTLREKSFIKEISPVETNIIFFRVGGQYTAQSLYEKFREENILISKFSTDSLRIVLHLDITEDLVNKTIEVIKKL